MLFRNPTKNTQGSPGNKSVNLLIGIGTAALYGVAASLFFITKKTPREPEEMLDIEVRYNVEEDDDTTFLVQNLIKIIKIVLHPLGRMVSQEEAKLIFVYADDGWEMRVRNGSEKLRHSVRQLLEAKEW